MIASVQLFFNVHYSVQSDSKKQPVSGSLFSWLIMLHLKIHHTLESDWFFNLTPGKKASWCFSFPLPNCQMVPCGNVYLLFSLWHLARALQRLGSGHRSRGDCPFLLRMVKSAPLAARKHAMDAALFFSAPWVPRPMINCRAADMKRRKKKPISGTFRV